MIVLHLALFVTCYLQSALTASLSTDHERANALRVAEEREPQNLCEMGTRTPSDSRLHLTPVLFMDIHIIYSEFRNGKASTTYRAHII